MLAGAVFAEINGMVLYVNSGKENNLFTTKSGIMENVLGQQPEEGKLTKAIEKQTAKIPSDAYLLAALSAMGVSLALQCLGRKHSSLFVGQWVSSFLLFGIYNKIVKVEGHD